MEEQEVKTMNRYKVVKHILTALLYIIVAIIIFTSGIYVCWYSLDEDMRTLIKVKKTIDEEYYKEIDDDLFYGEIFNTISDKVLDDYSLYMTEEEYSESKIARTGSRVGIGVAFLIETEEGEPQTRIARVSGNSPAEEAGVLEGDCITSFGETQADMQESFYLQDFFDFLANLETGQSFYLQVKRGGEDKLFQISKKEYIENYVFYRTNEKGYAFAGERGTELVERGEPLPALDKDTAYIRLHSFNGNAAQNFHSAMKFFKEQGKKNLVLDLRGNGGGYVSILQEIAGYFCKNTHEKQPIVSVADYGEYKENVHSVNRYAEYFKSDSRIMALADGNTASASESLLGCMLDYGSLKFEDLCLSTRIGGAKTYGKGIMQTTFSISNKGGAIKLTTAKVYWPISGMCIHDRGILPEDGTKIVEKDYSVDGEINASIAKLFA